MPSSYVPSLTTAPHSGAWLLDILSDLMWLSFEKSAEAARQYLADRRRRAGLGATLRPGPDTPLWSSLADRVQPHLADWGKQTQLARELEVPRQRVHEYFITRTRMPDAERMLRVLTWLLQQETAAGELVHRGAQRARARAEAGDQNPSPPTA